MRLEDADARGTPPSWIGLRDPSLRGALLAEQWRELPRFGGYLRASLLDTRIYLGDVGLVLVYLLRDWMERDVDRFAPGLMIGGPPEPDSGIDGFEAGFGTVPAALRAAWKAHTFLLLKNGRWLASPQPRFASAFGSPRPSPLPLVGWVGETRGSHECLEIVDPGSDISGCLTRDPGARAWRDRIVYREGAGALVDSPRPTLDATLADWERSDWSP